MIYFKCQSAIDAYRNDNIEKIREASAYYYDNELKKFIDMISKHPELIYMPPAYSSWLHTAASDGKVNFCSALFDIGMPVDICNSARSDWYDTPLVDAAASGQFATVKFFCDHGASVNGLPRGVRTPLIAAVMRNAYDCFKYLLTLSPDINRLHSVENMTALDLAKLYGYPEIVETLSAHGAKSAREIIYPENERAPGVLEFFYDNAGMILSPKFTTINGNCQIDIRTALIGEGNKHKILFTIGGYQRKPHKEFYLCLPSKWPLNNALLESNDAWSFPVQLLQKVTDYWLDGGKIEEGVIIAKEDIPWDVLPWSKDIDGFIAVDHKGEENLDDSIGDDEENDTVTLLILAPVTFPKNGRLSGKKLHDWIDKKRHLKWPRFALKKEWWE